MKSYVTHGNSGSQGHSERLDRAIEVLVIDRVLVMPDSSVGTCDLVANESNAIARRSRRNCRSRLDLVDRRSRPGPDRSQLSLRGKSARGKCERTGRARDIVATVGDVVVHVALPGMRLAPDILMRGDVLRFGIISCPGIQRRV